MKNEGWRAEPNDKCESSGKSRRKKHAYTLGTHTFCNLFRNAAVAAPPPQWWWSRHGNETRNLEGEGISHGYYTDETGGDPGKRRTQTSDCSPAVLSCQDEMRNENWKWKMSWIWGPLLSFHFLLVPLLNVMCFIGSVQWSKIYINFCRPHQNSTIPSFCSSLLRKLFLIHRTIWNCGRLEGFVRLVRIFLFSYFRIPFLVFWGMKWGVRYKLWIFNSPNTYPNLTTIQFLTKKLNN